MRSTEEAVIGIERASAAIVSRNGGGMGGESGIGGSGNVADSEQIVWLEFSLANVVIVRLQRQRLWSVGARGRGSPFDEARRRSPVVLARSTGWPLDSAGGSEDSCVDYRRH